MHIALQWFNRLIFCWLKKIIPMSNFKRLSLIISVGLSLLLSLNFVAQQYKPNQQKTFRAETQDQPKTNGEIIGKEHYALSNGLKIYLWEKYHKDFEKTFKQSRKIVLLVHGKTWS